MHPEVACQTMTVIPFAGGVAICLDGLVPDNHYKCVVADVNIDVSACGILGQACCHGAVLLPPPHLW